MIEGVNFKTVMFSDFSDITLRQMEKSLGTEKPSCQGQTLVYVMSYAHLKYASHKFKINFNDYYNIWDEVHK